MATVLPSVAAWIFSCSQRGVAERLLVSSCGNANHGAQLAIDLDGNLDLVFASESLIIFRPGSAQQIVLLADLLPQLEGEVGSEGRE